MKVSKRVFFVFLKFSLIYNVFFKNVDIIFSNNWLGDLRVWSNSVFVIGLVGIFN